MSYIGRLARSRRMVFPETGRGVIIPIDHGLTAGPIKGIETLDDIAPWIGSSFISAVIAHKGMMEKLIQAEVMKPECGIIVHLNGMSNDSPDPDSKVPLTSVEYAQTIGADAVSLQLNFTEKNFSENLGLLGKITDESHMKGLPVLVMVYDKMSDENSISSISRLSRYIRILAEMGVHAVKLPRLTNGDAITNIVNDHARNIKILFAGGNNTCREELINFASFLGNVGAHGMCVGRGVFQNPRPDEILKEIAMPFKTEAVT